MTVMDPREQQGYKAKRHEEKQILLLGAILDALKELKAPQPVAAPASAPARRQKAD